MSMLKQKYIEEISKDLHKQFEYKSVMEIPKLEKIVINAGVGDAVQDAKNLESIIKELTLIAGQKPVTTLAKKSIATFKLRQGQAIGAKVTLRGEKM